MTQRPQTRPLILFFLAWILPTALLRSASLFLHLPADGPLSIASGRFTGFILGASQDLFIALEVLVLCLCARRLFGHSGRVFAAFNSLLYTVLFGYVIFDFLLFWKIGIRMNLQFLEYVRMAGSFAGSIEALDPRPLYLGLVLTLILALTLFVYFSRRTVILKRSFNSVLLIAALAALAPVATAVAPAVVSYYAGNPLFNGQHTWVSENITDRQVVRKWTDAGNAPSPLQAFSRAEVLTRVDPNYPLLKWTEGFEGEKLFNIVLKTGERPHVIFLFLESFRAADIGALGGKYGVSPNFDGLSRQGILFSRFYANGIQTTRGVLASLYGIFPRFSLRSVQSGEPDLPLIGLPTLFKRRGYRTAFIHNGPLAFEGQDRFLTRHAFDEVYGDESIRQKFPSAAGTSWGPFDEYLMPYAVEWLLSMDRMGVPAFLTMLTMTNHHPWKTPAGHKAPRVEDVAAMEYRHYLSSFNYADKCLGSLLEMLKTNGLDKRTLVFILADTSQPMGEHNLNYFLINHLYEENLRIPMLILAEGRIAEPKSIDHIGSQVDLLPTVMDIFGMQGLNHAVGTSLVRRVPDRSVFFNNPYLLGYWGLRKNDFKYIYCVDTAGAALYDLAADPRETRNRTDVMPEPTAEYHDLVFGIHRLFEKLYTNRQFTKRALN